MNMKLKRFVFSTVVVLLVSVCVARTLYAAPDDDRTALQKTSEAIRAAFAKGDVATAMKFHHPEVNKALSFQKVLIGRDAVAADLRNTFQQFHLDFVENRVESLLIEDKTAVEETLFTIKSTPLREGNRFSSKGAP